MGDIYSDDDQNVLGIVFGEYGHILFYGFIKSECPIVWQRMMYFIRRRCERKGHSCVDAVHWGYTNLCCENHKDRFAHWWFTEMWPNVKEAPFKDIFHAFKMVTASTPGSSHELHVNFCRCLSGAVLQFT